MKKRVLLLSTVHPPTDPRIVYRILPSLAAQYELYCALPHATQDSDPVNITLIRLPRFTKLAFRILFSHPVVMLKCLRLRPDVVHIFVPELIPLALLFRFLGSNIIYEVQENMYKKFSIKRINNARLFRQLFHYFDHLARRKFFLVFTEPAYLAEYSDLAYPATIVHNYVSLSFIDSNCSGTAHAAAPHFLYAGVISLERCFDVLVAAFARLKSTYPDFRVDLFGPVRISGDELKTLKGFDAVKSNLVFHGYTDQKRIIPYAARASAGIALLKPVADYPDSYPTKLFEYMALKLPVITSDFPLYRQVVEASACGFCISAYDVDLLHAKLGWIIQNPEDARRMGERGRRSVEADYNWRNEEKILLSLYANLMAA